MTYTFDERIVSDLHKDAFGFRPREYFWEEWNGATDAGKQEIWDDLQDALDRAIEYENLMHDAAIADFRVSVQQNLDLGASDEHQARKWIVQSLNPTENDLLYGGSWVCFELGLPYSMRQMFDQICRELRQEMNNMETV
jgi:hypothetical protein